MSFIHLNLFLFLIVIVYVIGILSFIWAASWNLSNTLNNIIWKKLILLTDPSHYIKFSNTEVKYHSFYWIGSTN